MLSIRGGAIFCAFAAGVLPAADPPPTDDAAAAASSAVQGIADQAEQLTKPKFPTFTGAPTQALGSMVGGKRTRSRKNKKM